MITAERAAQVAAEWIAAWNAHDLEAILSHYADDLEFTSPLVVQALKRADGTLRSKAELRGYFALGIGPGSSLRFALLDVLPGVASVTLYYRNHRGQTVAEMIMLDDDNRIVKAMVHYH